ncbi:MAG: hypothetical protein H6718_32985 [Polyangiaceae bacterium]|nr:hypothetical protein [Polyangiaceae bacterium]MCB9605071.1 hypothetical protein [Polyangiaceae bacterium]
MGAFLGVVTFSGQALAQPADPPAAPAPGEPDAEEKPADTPAGEDGESPQVDKDDPPAVGPPAAADDEDTDSEPDAALASSEASSGNPPKPPPPPPPSDAVAGKDFRSRFVLESARAPFLRPDPEVATGQIRGEYQFRVTGLSDLPLKARPGGPDSLGQTLRVEHWLRLTPRFLFRDDLELVGQIDVPRGFIAGQETQEVGSAEEPYDERFPVKVAPRWLYLTWNSPIGVFRVGQQPSHWGLGLVANDGNHQSLFGDYRGGSIVERVLFATKPGGKDSKVVVAAAGDLVFKDRTADLTDDEYAWQGVLALTYSTDSRPPDPEKPANQIGLYAVYRNQSREAQSAPGLEFDEHLEVVALDTSGSFNAKLPGEIGHVFGGFELAYLLGSTDQLRTRQEVRANEREQIRAFGGALQLGAVLTEGTGEDRYGRWVMQMEYGWASGDADPNDGTSRRFTFESNHNVGLILFDEVLAWKTARAAVIAEDQGLTQRPAPGSEFLPSDGGIFGATYLYPTIVFRPLRQLDLKAGLVLAQTTADFVDPVAVTTEGRFVNYDGGDARSRDLGLELDAGVEYRWALNYGINLELGAQGGVFFPGKAFDDAQGNSLGTQYIGVGRMGLQF